jgi:hypothetical protein
MLAKVPLAHAGNPQETVYSLFLIGLEALRTSGAVTRGQGRSKAWLDSKGNRF